MKRFHFSILEKKVDRRLNVKGKDLTPKRHDPKETRFDPKETPKMMFDPKDDDPKDDPKDDLGSVTK